MSNLKTIEAFFAAYAGKNVAAIREVMADDISWSIPGHHPLSGTKHGIPEVLAFFDQLALANFKAEPIVIVEQDEYVVDHHRGWSDEGPGLDVNWCLIFKFDKGRIKQVTNLCADQHKADAFFWSIYKLKPIPERLA